MENTQNTNNFDSMLKQSLEGSQMPVPSGVWEAVGSSIGAKAIVAAKVASLKLIILKTVAGIVLAGGAGYGIYELLTSDTPKQQSTEIVTINQSTPTIAIDTIFPAEIIVADNNSVAKTIISKDSMIIYTAPQTVKDEEVIINPEIKNPQGAETKSTEQSSKSEPVTKVEPTPTKETPVITKPKDNVKEEEKFSANDIIIPDVITPNDPDGLNDCFKITIENENLFVLQIFNHENKRVFETTDKNKCWNGRDMYTGQMCPKGVYSYKLIFELKTGYKRTIPGKVTLL